MILGSGRAPGKVILFGEHAVVYGRPALAVPVTQVQAEAVVEPGEPGAGLTIVAADLGETIAVRDAPADHPLAAAARLTLVKFGLDDPDWRVTVRSTIPIASGMGSGAAVSAAIVRALVEAADRVRDQGSGVRTESGRRQLPASSFQLPVSSLLTSPRWSTRSSASTTARPAASTTPSSSTVSRSISCAGSRRRRFTSAGRSCWLSPTPASTARPRSRWGMCGGRGSGSRRASSRCSTGSRRWWRPLDRPSRRASRSGWDRSWMRTTPCSRRSASRARSSTRWSRRRGPRARSAPSSPARGRGGNMIALVTADSAPQVADALRRGGRGAGDRD